MPRYVVTVRERTYQRVRETMKTEILVEAASADEARDQIVRLVEGEGAISLGELGLDWEETDTEVLGAYDVQTDVVTVTEFNPNQVAPELSLEPWMLGDDDEEPECSHDNAVLSDSDPPATYHCPDCGENFIHDEEEEASDA